MDAGRGWRARAPDPRADADPLGLAAGSSDYLSLSPFHKKMLEHRVEAMDAAAIEEQLTSFLRKDPEVRHEPLARDLDFVESGLIDSMDLARLATELEALASIEVPDADVTPENFGSIEKMMRYAQPRA